MIVLICLSVSKLPSANSVHLRMAHCLRKFQFAQALLTKVLSLCLFIVHCGKTFRLCSFEACRF